MTRILIHHIFITPLVRNTLSDGNINIYAIQKRILKSGIGVARDDGEYGAAAFTGIAADWETRRYFTSYENHLLWTDNTEKHIQHKARIGVAPYIGDYGDLHTWLMLQADYDVGADDNFSITPLVRFFKGNTMAEAGYNFDNGVQLNFVQRF